MLVLAKAMMGLLLGFVVSLLAGAIIIPLLKKLKIKQTVSVFLFGKHDKKTGTPTMGGLIFIIPTILIVIGLLLTGAMEYSSNLFIVLFVFIAHAVLGFTDDYLSIKKGDNEGLTIFQKLAGEVLISLVFFYVFMSNGGSPNLIIHTLGININMGWLYGVFIIFILLASSNAVNLTDGLDGLAGGLSLIAFLSFGMIAWGSTWASGSQDLAIFSFVLAGSLLGFLYYNSYPAKVFMGDTGSLALGGAMATIAILTNHEITLIVVAGVFVLETLSAIVQVLSVRFRGKKVFLMTPLHHHFEKLGYAESDIVRTFYAVGLILSMLAIGFGVWL